MENRYEYTRYNEGATIEYIRKFILEHNPFLKNYLYENSTDSLYFYQNIAHSNNFLSIGYVVKYTGEIYRGGFNCNSSIRIVENLLNSLIVNILIHWPTFQQSLVLQLILINNSI